MGGGYGGAYGAPPAPDGYGAAPPDPYAAAAAQGYGGYPDYSGGQQQYGVQQQPQQQYGEYYGGTEAPPLPSEQPPLPPGVAPPPPASAPPPPAPAPAPGNVLSDVSTMGGITIMPHCLSMTGGPGWHGHVIVSL